jgi:thioredoxin-related protein
VKLKTLSQFVAFVLIAFTVAARAAGGGTEWGTDYAAALKEAKASNKMILADFTGSDWCGWCIKLDKETYSQPAFKNYAKQHLVLLKLDYPQNIEQSEAVKKQNEELKEKYNIEGFPTTILISPAGKELDRKVGYVEGGPAAMIQWIKSQR